MSDLGQHDGDGIRYAMHLSAPKGGSAQMLRDPAGGWVSWEDYARLKAEVERLQSIHSIDSIGIEQLKAEVERLTKAGDNLERVLTARSGSYEAGNASHEWQSAKNYKPTK